MSELSYYSIKVSRFWGKWFWHLEAMVCWCLLQCKSVWHIVQNQACWMLRSELSTHMLNKTLLSSSLLWCSLWCRYVSENTHKHFLLMKQFKLFILQRSLGNLALRVSRVLQNFHPKFPLLLMLMIPLKNKITSVRVWSSSRRQHWKLSNKCQAASEMCVCSRWTVQIIRKSMEQRLNWPTACVGRIRHETCMYEVSELHRRDLTLSLHSIYRSEILDCGYS